jgi:hypothetical protein
VFRLLKISQTEEALRKKKVLNEEQLAALASKASLERSLEEYDALKAQLEVIAASQFSAAALSLSKTCVEASTGTQQACGMTSQEVQTISLSASTATTSNASIQGLKKLLKALHVYSRYHDYTGLTLPDEVALFGMALLGLSSVSDFDDRVAQSARTAALYLDVSKVLLRTYSPYVLFWFVSFCSTTTLSGASQNMLLSQC